MRGRCNAIADRHGIAVTQRATNLLKRIDT